MALPSPLKTLAGFFLSGFLFALLGAILPVWGYHRDPAAFVTVGNYFLSVSGAVVASFPLASRLVARYGVSFLLVLACVTSCGALVLLGFVTPPAHTLWRVGGLVLIGLSAGMLNTGLFHALSDGYQRDPAGTVSRGGIFYGLGCLALTLLAGLTFYAYTVPSIFILMAVVPAYFAGIYARTTLREAPTSQHPTLRQALSDFRSPGAVLFALLLFVQFGNEWSIAGWLPLFLIRRVGLSPKVALLLLTLFWFALLAGRIGAVYLLPRIRHGRLLAGSVLAAIFGCVLLYFTNNAFGAGTGALLVGAGFATIYPLVAERIGRRFSYYHPGFFNGIFSFGLMGGLLAPAALGYLAARLDIGVVMALPLIGTFTVFALLLLIWLESKVTGR